MREVNELWLKWNEYANLLCSALGRTNNIVGEYAEHLAHRHYGGSILAASTSSADIISADGVRYQVKARKVKGAPSTKLGVIRSWDFDYLIVIIFDEYGRVTLALELPVEVAKEHGVVDAHQNGRVITTGKRFRQEHRAADLTAEFRVLQEQCSGDPEAGS